MDTIERRGGHIRLLGTRMGVFYIYIKSSVTGPYAQELRLCNLLDNADSLPASVLYSGVFEVGISKRY